MRQQVVDLLPLVDGRPAAVDLVQGGVGVVHPLHQPLQLTIAQQVVATQISTHISGHMKSEHPQQYFFLSSTCLSLRYSAALWPPARRTTTSFLSPE